MRIALISSLFPPFAVGGAEQVAAQLALAFHRLGHHVEVVTTGRCSSVDCWEGIRVWRLAPYNFYWGHDKPANRMVRAGWHAVDLWNPSVIGPLSRVLDLIGPDVINTHNIDGLSPVVWQVARRYTSAVVHTLHDYHLMCPRATMRRRDGAICRQLCGTCRVYARYHRLFQRHVRVLVAPAGAIAARHREGGWRQPATVIIRNGVDVEPVTLGEAPENGPLRVLFLARLEPEKGCHTLAAAVRLIGDRPDIRFDVAGEGSCAGLFAALAAEVSNVRWHGFVTGHEKSELLRRADVFLQLSECHENAPLSLIEAQSSGLCLVGANVGGIPEYVEAGQLIPPGDPRALAKILLSLAANKPAIRADRPRRLEAAAGYGTREMALEYLKLFDSLGGPHGFQRKHEGGQQPGVEQV